jgi:hypothetical protein
MVVLNRKLALDVAQSERAEIDIGSRAKTVSEATVIVSTSSSGFQSDTTENWSEVVNEVVEGVFSAKGREKFVSILDEVHQCCWR